MAKPELPTFEVGSLVRGIRGGEKAIGTDLAVVLRTPDNAQRSLVGKG